MRTIRLFVTGTQFERRYDTIRTLELGTRVTLQNVKDNAFDPDAVAVKAFSGSVQLGWIPREAAIAIRGLGKRFGRVVSVGTDRTGRWTKLEIEIAFKVDTPAAKVVAEYGPVIASVLYLMSPKNPTEAAKIAKLPKDEQKLAIDEWNMNQQDGGDRRRRKL